MSGPDGAPAPASLFTVSPEHVVVPAGGTKEVTVTADTRPDQIPTGRYTGRLVATAPDVEVITPSRVLRIPSTRTVSPVTRSAKRPG